jgi:predicted RNA-binding protein YlxR (DUF448 family)
MEQAGPIRMCVSCRRRAPQRALIRLAVDDDGVMVVGQLRRRGRGAYVCPRHECLAAAHKRGALQRGLRTRGQAPAPQQIATSAAAVVGSRLARIARCETASTQREELSRLLAALRAPGMPDGIAVRPKGDLANAHG